MRAAPRPHYASRIVWIPRPIRWAASALTTTVMLYVFFFVPIGERTLCDHVKRIARTPEAQDLGRDLGRASIRVAERTREELEQGIALSALGDAGPPRHRPDIDDGTPRPSSAPHAPHAPHAPRPAATSFAPLGEMPRNR